MNKKPQNASIIFDLLFKNEKLSGVPSIYIRLGKISFTISFLAQAMIVLGNSFNVEWINDAIYNGLSLLFSIGFLSGVTALAVVGVYSYGLRAGYQSFFISFFVVMKKVTLYVFLPCIVIATLLFIWAYYTKQPIFSGV